MRDNRGSVWGGCWLCLAGTMIIASPRIKFYWGMLEQHFFLKHHQNTIYRGIMTEWHYGFKNKILPKLAVVADNFTAAE